MLRCRWATPTYLWYVPPSRIQRYIAVVGVLKMILVVSLHKEVHMNSSNAVSLERRWPDTLTQVDDGTSRHKAVWMYSLDAEVNWLSRLGDSAETTGTWLKYHSYIIKSLPLLSLFDFWIKLYFLILPSRELGQHGISYINQLVIPAGEKVAW